MYKMTPFSLRAKCLYIALFFLCVLGATSVPNVYAKTDYIVLERLSDLHIFEKYTDYLATTKDPIAIVKKLTMDDPAWRAILKEYFNTINDVRYSDKGYVVVENKKYGFEIHFMHKHENDSIVWTCNILDDSFFFHPKECKNWEKKTSTK
jgi:hypothetical protein